MHNLLEKKGLVDSANEVRKQETYTKDHLFVLSKQSGLKNTDCVWCWKSIEGWLDFWRQMEVLSSLGICIYVDQSKLLKIP